MINALALLLLLVRAGYWTVTEVSANRAKPKRQPLTLRKLNIRFISVALELVLIAQLIGWITLIPFRSVLAVQIAGLIITIVGFVVCIAARHTIGANWAHGAEYQIKTRHELVTSGVYHYVRHPIYTGIFLSGLGVELIVGSWLAIIGFVLVPLAFNQARREERILAAEFGDKYLLYMAHTSRFLPGL